VTALLIRFLNSFDTAGFGGVLGDFAPRI